MVGRPQSTEADPYYFTYINQVAGEDPLAVMESQMEEFAPLFAGVSEEKSLHRYSPEKWSIRQTLSHLSDVERIMSGRALWFARGFAEPLPSFDQHTGVSGAGADNTPWAAHVEEFRRVRLASISLFRNMPAAGWERSGIASGKQFTVRALAYLIPGHSAHHVKILRERYL